MLNFFNFKKKTSLSGKLKVVVTGGAGFIGSHLAKQLLVEGFEVWIIDNLTTGKKENIPEGAIFRYGDIRHVKELVKIFKEIGSIECVFHLAAAPGVQFSIDNPFKTNDINIIGTFNVIHVSDVVKAKKLIYSSSASIYGNPEIIPTPETSIPHPLSPYAVHKHVGEHYCDMYSLVYNLPTVCLRYFNVYGPGQPVQGAYTSVITLFIELKKQNKTLTITGDGKQTRDFVHVSDVVRANIAAMRSDKVGKAECINIASGVESSVNAIADMFGGNKAHIAPRIEPLRSFADISLAKKLLSWSPKVSLKEGIQALKKASNI